MKLTHVASAGSRRNCRQGTRGACHQRRSVAHPDKRHVCISLATTVPLIFTSYSSLHSDISGAATSKQKTVWCKYLSLIFQHVTRPSHRPVRLSIGCTANEHTHSHDMQNPCELLYTAFYGKAFQTCRVHLSAPCYTQTVYLL
jgi:hypothetical protein